MRQVLEPFDRLAVPAVHTGLSTARLLVLQEIRGLLDPGHWFYEVQKARVRVGGLLEALERALGARGGGGLQVDFRGANDLTTAIRVAGRRIAIGLAAATAIVGTAVTASAVHTATWATVVFGVVAALLTGGLLIDVVRGR